MASSEQENAEDQLATESLKLLRQIPAFGAWQQAEISEPWIPLIESANKQTLMSVLAEILPRLMERP